jgi:hypothetical protein
MAKPYNGGVRLENWTAQDMDDLFTGQKKQDKALSDHAQNDIGYWNELQKQGAINQSQAAILMDLQSKIADMQSEIEQLHALPVTPATPMYDMAAGTVLKTPPLIGLLGVEIPTLDLIGASGWTAPQEGKIVFDGASTIGLLTSNWIKINDIFAAPGEEVDVLVLGNGDGGEIVLENGDNVKENGIGNITFYPRVITLLKTTHNESTYMQNMAYTVSAETGNPGIANKIAVEEPPHQENENSESG